MFTLCVLLKEKKNNLEKFKKITKQYFYNAQKHIERILSIYGAISQFVLSVFERGQTHFSQLHISQDLEEVESHNFVCSLITELRVC